MIQWLVAEIWRIKQIPQNTYTQKLLAEYKMRLAQFRSVAVYYRECSSIENIELLGKKYIAQMKRDLPPLVFQTSILCIRLEKLKDGFYPALSETRHMYSAYDNSYLLNLDYDLDKIKEPDCRQDGDLDLDDPIRVAFDYN